MTSHPNSRTRRCPFPPVAHLHPQPASGRTLTPETPLQVKTFGLRSDRDAMAYLHQRAGFKLGKFALVIRHVEVRLKDESGPKGSPEVRCSISVHLDEAGCVIVEHGADSSRAAFDLAIDRVERAVRRLLQRRRSPRNHHHATR